MNVEQKRRELFEAWMAKQAKMDQWTVEAAKDDVFAENVYGQYAHSVVQSAWAGFNAALDAVEIELGAEFCPETDYQDGYVNALIKCRAAIESTGLGLKVKP